MTFSDEDDRLETISQMRSRIENGDLHEREVNINDVSLKNVINHSNIKSIKRMLSPSRLHQHDLSLEKKRRNQTKSKYQTEV